MKVDQVVQRVLSLGKGALLAKIDIESAFRNIPVHPDDRHLLGMRWNDELFIDLASDLLRKYSIRLLMLCNG